MSANRSINYQTTFKNNVIFEQLPKTTNGNGAVAGSGVSVVEHGDGITHKSVFTLADFELMVGNTTGVSFGGTKFYDFPLGRILIEGVVMKDITLDLSDVRNSSPIDGADGGDMSIGTTAPSDGTLTGTDVDLCPSTSIDPLSGGIAQANLAASAHFNGAATAIDAYLNMLIDDADVGDGAEDMILVNGTIIIYWKNLSV